METAPDDVAPILLRWISGVASTFEAHRPASEDMSERGDIALRVAAIDAQRVQLHDLAGIVLVDPRHLSLLPARAGRHVAPVVEIDQHGGMLRGGEQEFAELAERIDRKSTRLNSSHIPLSRMPS